MPTSQPTPQQQAVMAPQQVQQAVASTQAAKTVKSILSGDICRKKFAEVLGNKSAGFLSSVIQVSNQPALLGADPQTVVNAAMVAATLDLPINNSLGFAYIVAYNDKRMGKQAQFQIGYKGLIQLAQRSGQYKTINATDVREGEILEEDLLSGEIKFSKLPPAQRVKANVVGYAAFFRLTNGFEKTLYMSKEEVTAHAKQYSMSFRNDKYNNSLWATQFDLMAKKTVLKLLLSKYGPLTIEFQRVQQFDQAVITGDTTSESIETIDEADVTYVDNQPSPVDAGAPEPTEQQQAAAAASRAAVMEAASRDFSRKPGAEPSLNL